MSRLKEFIHDSWVGLIFLLITITMFITWIVIGFQREPIESTMTLISAAIILRNIIEYR